MLIAFVLGLIVAGSGPRRVATSAAWQMSEQAAVSVVAQEPAGQTPVGQTPAPPRKPKKAAKEKKPKKKAAVDAPPSPDEDEDPDAADIEPGVGPRLSWRQHPSLRFGSVFRADFEAKFQEDGHASYDGAVANGLQRWEMHRNRIGIKGKLFTHIQYEIERELTEKELTEKDVALGLTPNSQWKDVNVNLTFMKKAQIQIGKFKVPFGLDELTSVTHNDFVYRSLGANYLAPGRDIGTMVHGSYFKHGFTYAAGVFQHDGDNARSKKIEGGNATFAARVTAAPFRRLTSSSLGSVGLGTAFAISQLSDDSFRPNGLRSRTVLTQDTFFDPVYVKGHRRRWEADADWAAGPASARAEYTWESDDRQGQGLGDQDLPDVRARAWYVSGTWILTGENKRRPVRAETPFLQGGAGAVEIAARYERIWYDSVGGTDAPFRNPRAETIFGSGDRVLTLGVNWTLNRFMKILVNGIREHVEDPERSPVPNGAAFWSRVVRLQFVL